MVYSKSDLFTIDSQLRLKHGRYPAFISFKNKVFKYYFMIYADMADTRYYRFIYYLTFDRSDSKGLTVGCTPESGT